MRNIAVRYVRKNPRTGKFEYRRRVPTKLASRVRKREFLKVLGANESEALINYGPYHRDVEHLINLAKHGVEGLTPQEQAVRLTALLRSWDADPFSAGKDENERIWREEAAAKLVDDFQDPNTGEYFGVPEENSVTASALLSGVSKQTQKITVTDAFAAYLEEKAKPTPNKRRKQLERYRSREKELLSILGGNRQLEGVTRSDARRWRDSIAARVAPATVQRYRNDISAVFNWAIGELDGAGESNPFSKLEIKGQIESRQNQRLPLPQTVIDNVYVDLAHDLELLQIWTLLDHTGARPSEIRELTVSEVLAHDPIPHIIIQARADRTLKTSWSERKVPLIGQALEVAKVLVRNRNGPDQCFPRFMDEDGLEDLSKALNKSVRQFTKNPKHVAYSLRHNLADRMNAAEIYERVQLAILGHATNKGQNASYGSQIPLAQLQEALNKALKDHRA